MNSVVLTSSPTHCAIRGGRRTSSIRRARSTRRKNRTSGLSVPMARRSVTGNVCGVRDWLSTRPVTDHSDVLIDKNRIPVGVHHEKTGGPRRVLICFVHHLHALRLELALQFAHVCESNSFLGVAVPAGVEGQNILVEHAL